MNDERPYPMKGDTLFHGGLDIDATAEISRWTSDFSSYGKGYKDGADIIVTDAIAQAESQTSQIPYIVFPVVFLYRQYIELRLKETIALGTLIKGGMPDLSKYHHHRINDIWKDARPYIEAEPLLGAYESLDALDACIKEFSTIDPDGMAFRYPVDKKGNAHLPKATAISLRHLKDTMEKIGNLLDDATGYMYMALGFIK